jgi:hypothetical protein
MNNDYPNTCALRFVGFSRTRQPIRVLFVLAVAALMAGCGTFNFQAGNLPNIEALENTLKLGESTENDVSRVLGEPFGKGREMLPFHEKSRPMWSYYYEQGYFRLSGSGDGRRVFLFVFFNQGRYDGYMWFSSLPEHRAKLL